MHRGLGKLKCCVRYTDLGQVLPHLVAAAAVVGHPVGNYSAGCCPAVAVHPVGTVVLVGIDLAVVAVHPVGTADLVGIDLAVVAVLEHPVPVGLDLAVDIDPDFDPVVVVLRVFDLYHPQEVGRHCKTIVIR